MLERSTLRSLGLLALFCGSSALAGSESAATRKVESVETSVCRLIESSARTQSLPVAFLTRLIWQESSFRSNSISPAGAQGIAQFMPKTADERGLANPFDPRRSDTKIRRTSRRPQAAFRQSWTGRRRLQCRSCPCCELARRPRQFAGRDRGLRSDHHATSGPRLDRRRRGGNDNRQRNILEAILFTSDSRHSPLRTSLRCRLSTLCTLGRPARRQFFEGGGAGRLHPRPAHLFRYYWQDRTHGHRRSRAQPRLRSILSSTRTCALAHGS